MSDNPLDLADRVNSLTQVTMQAVQVYLKNVPMFISNCQPDKLLVLIDFIINSVKICVRREVLDKRDLVVQKLLRKSFDLKTFLESNHQSKPKFVSVVDEKPWYSTIYKNPYGSKLSMYDSAGAKPKTARNPHAGVKPRALQSQSSIASGMKPLVSRNVQKKPSRVASPRVRKSISEVSTAVQKVNPRELRENVAEKPEEEVQPPAVNDNRKERELMEMIQDITKEKIQEMLLPFIARLSDSQKPQDSFSPELKSPPKRVTSEVEAVKPEAHEKVERISKNVQYLYVKSNDDGTPSKASIAASPMKPAKVETKRKFLQPPVLTSSGKSDKDIVKELKERALKERLDYVSQMMENPLYNNEAHSEPWRMFAG